MTDPADPPPLRHSAVYRTVRGLALSGSRGLPGGAPHAASPALVAPMRVSAVLRVRPAGELAAPIGPALGARVGTEADAAVGHCDADGLYDAAGGRDARRYSEPND
jgi:hypothetical protein